MAGGGELELPRRAAIQQPGRQHAILDQGALLVGDAFAVERLGAQAARAVRIVDDADALGEDLLAHLVLEEAGAARDRRAVDGADEMADQAVGDARVVDDRASSRSKPCAD